MYVPAISSSIKYMHKNSTNIVANWESLFETVMKKQVHFSSTRWSVFLFFKLIWYCQLHMTKPQHEKDSHEIRLLQLFVDWVPLVRRDTERCFKLIALWIALSYCLKVSITETQCQCIKTISAKTCLMSNKIEHHVKCGHEDPIDDTISLLENLIGFEISSSEIVLISQTRNLLSSMKWFQC